MKVILILFSLVFHTLPMVLPNPLISMMIIDAESFLKSVWDKKFKPILLDNNLRDMSLESMEALIRTDLP